MAQFSISLVDYSNEITTTQLHVDDASTVAARNALASAVMSVTTLNKIKETFSQISKTPKVLPTAPYAQRETKGLVSFSDTVSGKQGTFTIGGWDAIDHPPTPGTDLIPLADGGDIAALVTALQTNAKSVDGNPITVNSIRLVGRSI